ncbi:autotransporter outer membrane beta-barrel domain-containing protein [Prosthecodimorpha staleyi]|uniref:Autotransporter domain-containing protein n=1 Tax=Prosthecodimorpha staleyi TaxID=2840188 RepID=A0A947D1D6_9HYPH|nr:autotransporter domain-containing protein [Prosthecodimorpha staleyi]MBT9288856.1 autotransporter domain-containing protein [Prosthecodimorpha staleyi]
MSTSMASAQSSVPLVVSAPAPGATYTVVGTETWGTATIGDGAGEAGTLKVGPGTSLTTGDISGSPTTIGNLAGSTGSVVVKGRGASWTDTGASVAVGATGMGSLSILNGGTASVVSLGISTNGGTGNVLVSGAGSKLTSTQHMAIGWSDGTPGSLVVEKGGSLETIGGYGGDPGGGLYIGGGGNVTIRDAGTSVVIGSRHSGTPSDWTTADGWFYIGDGTATLSNGASLESDGGYVSGTLAGGYAKMTVTGAGTTWNSGISLYVAGNGNNNDDGDGELTVSDGAHAFASVVGVGVDGRSTGTILVTGAGSRLSAVASGTLTGNFYVGSDGDGTLIVRDGATVTTDNQVRIGFSETASGLLVIGAKEGEAAAGAGTIIANGGVAFGDGSGTLVFNHTSDNLIFSNVLSGANGAIRQIAGVTDLTANSPDFAGFLTVVGGTLKVNGDLSAASANVFGGTFGGSGTIGALTVQSGGTVAPGNSIGTLHVANSFVQLAGSTYLAELSSTGTSDLISVGGTATLGGTVRVGQDSSYRFGQSFTILSAEDLTGTYTSDTVRLSAFATGTLSYVDDSDVVLTVSKSRSFASAGKSANQRAVAGVLDNLPADSELVIAAANQQTGKDARAAYDSLSGEFNATLVGQTIEASQIMRDSMTDRLRAAFGLAGASQGPVATQLSYAPAPNDPAGKAIAAPTTPGLAVWTRAYGNWLDSRGSGNAAGARQTIGGVLFGADAALADPSTRVGMMFGYGRGSVSSTGRSSSATTDDYHVGFYGGQQWGALGLRLGGALSLRDADTERHLNFSGFSEDTKGRQRLLTSQVNADLGYNIRMGSLALEPFAAAAYVRVNGLSDRESGSGAKLNVLDNDAGVGFSTLGLRFGQDFVTAGQPMAVRGSLAWRHAFGDVTPGVRQSFGNGSAFTVTGTPIARNTLVAEGGVDFRLAGGATLGLTTTGNFGSDTRSLSGRADLRWSF